MAADQLLAYHRVLFQVVAVLGGLRPGLAGQAAKVGQESLDLWRHGAVELGAAGAGKRRKVAQQSKKLVPEAIQVLGLLLHTHGILPRAAVDCCDGARERGSSRATDPSTGRRLAGTAALRSISPRSKKESCRTNGDPVGSSSGSHSALTQ